MDEFKGDFDYQTFLKLLDVYPNQVHARYSNIYALWDTVHISSIFTPYQIYTMLVPDKKRKYDPIQQLYRRIHYIVYHSKTIDNKYKSLTMTMNDYLTLVKNKLDFDNLIQNYITEDDASSDYTYTPNKKATADNTSTDQSETDNDS
ncbi:TPA: hypothetical protein U1C92_002092 [Streptococcus suis]|nr:hypothetical protein [Streptococcus suis]HEM3694385.1 hypothetical protein [Streptococcus suis]